MAIVGEKRLVKYSEVLNPKRASCVNSTVYRELWLCILKMSTRITRP